MKKTVSTFTIFTLIIFGITLAAGCREGNSSDSQRRARLVSSENLELKNKLKEKDKEIDKQKALLTECEKERQKMQEQADQAATGFMEILADYAKQLETLKQENAAFQKKIKLLESKQNS